MPVHTGTIVRSISHVLSPLEIQTATLGLMGRDNNHDTFLAILQEQLEDAESELNLILKLSKNQKKLKVPKFLAKLEALGPAQVEELFVGMRKVLESPPEELTDKDCLPRIDLLRGAGLVVPSKPVARTFTVVRLEDASFSMEVVGYKQPSSLDLPAVTMKECAHRIVDVVDRLRSKPSAGLIAELNRLCYALERLTKWSFNHVIRRGGAVLVEKISISAMQSDLADKSLQNIVLEGVNAVVKKSRRKQLDLLQDV